MRPMGEIESSVERHDSRRFLDVQRTDHHRRFFQTFRYTSSSELLYDIEHVSLDQDAFASSADARTYGYGGWLYWIMYLKGYTQYKARGAIDDENIYYKYLTLRYSIQDADPTMRSMSAPAIAVERISRRFSDCDQLSDPDNATRYVDERLEAVTAFVRSPPADEDELGLYEIGSSQLIRARLMDGHHRLFAARLFGVKRLRFDVRVEPTSVPELAGELEHSSYDGDRLQIRGWVRSQSRYVHCVEVRSENRTICRAAVAPAVDVPSPDQAETEHQFVFNVDAEAVALAGTACPLDIMVLENWLPVGKLRCDSL
jgi:hypothetical protein